MGIELYPEGAGPFHLAGEAAPDLPPGVIAIDRTVSPAVVILSSSPRICVHPDFAEEFASALMAQAAIARTSRRVAGAG